MLTSITKRALIGTVALACLATAGAGFYVYRLRQPLAALSAGRSPDILSQLPPKAPAIVYVHVSALRALRDSPLAALLGPGGSRSREDRDYENFVRATGFDYQRDLDKVAVALWPASLTTPPGAMGENRVLAIADGRFDQQKIEAYALRFGKVATRGTQSVYEVPGSPPVSFEFISPTRIELASGKDADNLLAPSSPLARDPAIQARIDRVAGAPLFAVARTDSLPGSFYANFRNSPQIERLARSVEGLMLAGQPDGDRIRMALDAECDSMKNAIEIATLLDGFRMIGSVALADPKTRRQMTQQQASFLDTFLREVKITHQDRWVRLTLDVTPAMLSPATSGR